MGSRNLAPHLHIIPIRSFHPRPTVMGHLIIIGIKHMIVQQLATFLVRYVANHPTDTLQNGISMCRHTFIISPLHDGIHGIRPHHGNLSGIAFV